MNKLLQKLAKLTLGLAMAAGIGVAVSAGKKGASPVHADEVTSNYTPTAACGGSGSGTNSVSWTITSDAAESTFEGTGSARGLHYGTGSKCKFQIRFRCKKMKCQIKPIY